MLIISLITWVSCANQVALTGGPRDEDPPKLDTTLSFANNQIHFEKQLIELYFDEFINLRDPAKQIVISPPLSFNPVINSRLKKVSIGFDEKEEFKQDATYIINFGEAIQDYNENNKLSNFTLVFSTGDYIDSLSVRGQVVDAFKRTKVENVLVMLYDNNYDSIPYKERPFYFAKTDKQGAFEIKNVRADTFKIFALVDQNLNYLYDDPSESIGFLDSLVYVTEIAKLNLELEIFKESSKPQYRGFEVVNQGKINIEFDTKGPIGRLMVLDSIDFFVDNRTEDLVKTLWYRPRELSSFKFSLLKQTEWDTLSVRINRRTIDTLPTLIKVTPANVDGKLGLDPQTSLVLNLDRPLDSFDRSKMFLIKLDSIVNDTLMVQVDSFSSPSMNISVSSDWVAGDNYSLTLLPGALTDFFNQSNDTIQSSIKIAKDEDFGDIHIVLNGIDSTVDYVLQLLKSEKLISEKRVDASINEVTFNRLLPGGYILQIIKDDNQNGKWDPGNYLEHKLSERIANLNLEEVRGSWIIESSVDLQTVFDGINTSDVTKDE